MSGFTLTLKGVADSAVEEIENIISHVKDKFPHVEATASSVEPEAVPDPTTAVESSTAVEPESSPPETTSQDASTTSEA